MNNTVAPQLNNTPPTPKPVMLSLPKHPSTINYQPSTINHQPSSIIHHLSLITDHSSVPARLSSIRLSSHIPNPPTPSPLKKIFRYYRKTIEKKRQGYPKFVGQQSAIWHRNSPGSAFTRRISSLSLAAVSAIAARSCTSSGAA